MFSQLRKRIPPLGRLEQIFLLLLAANAAAAAAEIAAGWTLPGWELLQLAGYLVTVVLLVKLARLMLRALLWRVRNRMILLFLFLGVVPLLLVSTLVGLAAYFLTGQVAVHMATTELDRRAGQLRGVAASLLWNWRASGPSRQEAFVHSYLERAAANWPGLQGLVRDEGREVVFPQARELDPPRAAIRNFQGIVRRENQFYLLARQGAAQDPNAAEVILVAPLDEAALAALAPGLGSISLLPLRGVVARETPGWTISADGSLFTRDDSRRPSATDSYSLVPAPAHRFDFPVTWLTSPLQIERWSDEDKPGSVMLVIHTRPSAVYRLLFGQRVEVAQLVRIGFVVVGILFLIVELVSLFVGISLTRTLTRSVHQLYEGTQKVNQGDFSHRIQVGGGDQLAELSGSFNSMTESIEKLIEESKERQRLASELEIAREVQEELFPKNPPQLGSLEIVGVCHAARMVSGDYYDFVKLSEDRLALAIGDVAGKGISGALLMASIQSMMRAQLSAPPDGGPGGRFPAAQVVSRLNLQLYQTTAPEKYATFFLGAYDDRQGLLTYTNAGHLPPLLIRDGVTQKLEVNGMVVGAFPFARYEQSEIQLHAGDLFVAFTDGVTEPENEFAEEFGEERLIEVILRNRERPPREIINEVIAAVGQWTGRPELQDDMTMLVARKR